MIFPDQVAVVTGAGSGIGRAVAVGLAAGGAEVCLVGRRADALEETASLVRGTRVHSYPTDLTVDAEVSAFAQRIADERGRVDMLIHSAGVIASGPLEAAPVAIFDWQYRTNLRAPYLLTQLLLPMLRLQRGQIVFINSTAGLNARASVSQYAATKFGLKALADSLREELNPAGVRVLTVYPGRTASPMQATVHEAEGKPYKPEGLLQPEDVAKLVLQALSLARTAEITDISVRPMAKT